MSATAMNTHLTLTTEGTTHVIVKRRFAASPEKVFRAHTDPKIVQQWLLGPDGWTMPECHLDARAGGSFRYVWAKAEPTSQTEGCSSQESFSITGEFMEVEGPHRIVHIERMHLPQMTTPDNHVETTFEADGDGTLMTMRMTLPDEKTRKMMLASGMEHGMEASYQRLERML